MMQEFYSVKEVANQLNVTVGTVRSWIKTGTLKASKPNGKNFIIVRTELDNLINKTVYKPVDL